MITTVATVCFHSNLCGCGVLFAHLTDAPTGTWKKECPITTTLSIQRATAAVLTAAPLTVKNKKNDHWKRPMVVAYCVNLFRWLFGGRGETFNSRASPPLQENKKKQLEGPSTGALVRRGPSAPIVGTMMKVINVWFWSTFALLWTARSS